MRVIVITMLSWLAVAATAAAQSTPNTKAASPGAPRSATTARKAEPAAPPSQAQLADIRALAHELQARTEKLSDLMEQYLSLVGRRPQANDAQLASWDAALERLLRRVDGARAAVVETMQRLEQLPTGQLPTALAKDVVRTRNEAVTQRTAAEEALVSNKPVLARAAQPAKPAPAAEDTSLSFAGDL